jgi:ABC-type multidrug transport system ATPase subunit
MVSSHLLSLVEDLCTHLLVLNLGKACFFGPTEEARRVHPNHRGDASLEEVFFQLTEGAGRDSPDRDGMVPEQPIARSSDEPADGAPEAPAAGDQP